MFCWTQREKKVNRDNKILTGSFARDKRPNKKETKQ